jgi:hypothetical protein
LGTGFQVRKVEKMSLPILSGRRFGSNEVVFSTTIQYDADYPGRYKICLHPLEMAGARPTIDSKKKDATLDQDEHPIDGLKKQEIILTEISTWR